MKSIILVTLALVAVAVAAPVEEPIKTIRSSFEQEPNGEYNRVFETENGIIVQEQGILKEVLDEDNKPHTVLILRGSYKYTDPEGKPVLIEYTADENGYQPIGDSIPTVAARR